jgi:hypothetical protein
LCRASRRSNLTAGIAADYGHEHMKRVIIIIFFVDVGANDRQPADLIQT